MVGTNILPSLMIPPKQEEFTLAGHCSSEYTKEFFPEDGLNVVIVNMHSHLAGKNNTNLILTMIYECTRRTSLLSMFQFIFSVQRSRAQSAPLQRWKRAAMAFE